MMTIQHRFTSFCRRLTAVGAFVLLPAAMMAQTMNPQAYYDEKGTQTETRTISDAQAPLTVEFRSNPIGIDGYTASYEWHFRHKPAGGTQREIFVRYEENTSYTFMESGSYTIVQKYKLVKPDDEIADSAEITVEICESKLEFPNAFSPNDDGINDIYRAKRDYKSIVSFRAIILNRWGQKLYEWNNPEDGWNGKYHGNDVKEGVYYVLVEAKGADGKEYKIKKDINLLRGHTEKSGTTTP